MKVRELRLYHLRIPLKVHFRHFRATRALTDNLVVETVLSDGTSGFGEGVPREYVTGETVETALEACRSLDRVALGEDFGSFGELLEFLEHSALVSKIGKGVFPNAARCSVEISLLDAFGRHFQNTFNDITAFFLPEKFVRRSPRRVGVRYSAIFSLDSLGKTALSALRFGLWGFRQVKVKVGQDDEMDLERLRMVRLILGSHADIRIDANGAWDLGRALRFLERALPYRISAVEEPLKPQAKLDLARLRSTQTVPVILDESLVSIEDAKFAVRNGLADIFNLRLSKCGGFTRSLQLAQVGFENGLACQLGCQVGETGILSAAGRHFATSVGNLKYLEGSYDRYLLTDNVTLPDITFGYAGKARPIPGWGLGVTVVRNCLDRLSVWKEVLPLD